MNKKLGTQGRGYTCSCGVVCMSDDKMEIERFKSLHSHSPQDNQATSEEGMPGYEVITEFSPVDIEKINKVLGKKEPESWESNCCCAEIDVVDEKYGICRQCHTRIGYHSPKDCAKYELVYTEEEVQELLQAQKDKMVEEVKKLDTHETSFTMQAVEHPAFATTITTEWIKLEDAINVINNND